VKGEGGALLAPVLASLAGYRAVRFAAVRGKEWCAAIGALGRRICAAVSGLAILFPIPMGILIRLRREGVLCAVRPSPFGNRVMGFAGACQGPIASLAPTHSSLGMRWSRSRLAA